MKRSQWVIGLIGLLMTMVLAVGCSNAGEDGDTDDSNTKDTAIDVTVDAAYVQDTLKKGGEVWFTFDAVADQKYGLYVDDKVTNGGDTSFTAYTKQSLEDGDGNSVATSGSFPREFTADTSEAIYIKVSGSSTGSEGTFGIKVERL